MTIKTMGFHHVALVATDKNRTRDFYDGLLGMPAVAEVGNAVLFGDGPGGWLSIEVRPGAGRGHWGVGGVHHVALGVADQAAQLKWKRRLQDAGVPVSGPYDRGWFHSIYFTDPDGQVLEIATEGPGYATDEPADALGRGVVMPRPTQMRGGRDEEAIAALTHPDPVQEVTADMALRGIHHVTGLTDDADRAHDFVTRVLGLALVKRSVNQDDAKTPHLFWARYDPPAVAPNSSYTLFDWRGSTYRTRAGAGQAGHIALRADGAAPEAWEEALAAHDIATRVLEDAFFRMISFAAPDGQAFAITAGAQPTAPPEPRP